MSYLIKRDRRHDPRLRPRRHPLATAHRGGAADGAPQMMTVAAYATYRSLRLSAGELASAGKRAKRYSDVHGFPIEVTAHRVYGKVNLYHVEVLREVFKQRSMFEGK